MKPRLHVYQAQDHFGPGLVGQPYWYAEMYDSASPGARPMWAAGFGTWEEAFRGGRLAMECYYDGDEATA